MKIRVRGSHSVSLAAEIGLARLAVQFEGEDAGATMTQAQSLANRIQAELRALPADALERFSFEAPQRYSWQPTAPDGSILPPRTTVTIEITAAFRDFEVLGERTADWGAHPGVQLRGVEWSLTPETKAANADAVLAEAVRDARRRAEVLAAAAGAGEVRILEIADPGIGSHEPVQVAGQYLRAKGVMDAGSESVSPSPSSIWLSAAVEAVFEA